MTPTAKTIAWSMVGLGIAFVVTEVAMSGLPHAVGDTEVGTVLGIFSRLVGLTSIVMGALIVSRRPENPIGWLFCCTLLYLVAEFSFAYALMALDTEPGAPPGGVAAAIISQFVFPAAVVFTLILLLFPTGHPPSPRWRFVAPLAIGGWVVVNVFNVVLIGPIPGFPEIENPLGVMSNQSLVWFVPVVLGLLAMLAALVAAAVSLFHRRRHAGREEREQIKWFLYAGTIPAAGFAILFFGGHDQIAIPVILLGWGAITVASAIAIFKYHLYDIDVVISKTVVFGALAVFITAVYVAIVVGIGAAIGTRGEPNLGLSILATAVVAVAFQPVRERVQRVANHLVYGDRATPYEVLSGFASNMASTYATDDLLPRMTEILASGTGASRAEVWLKVGEWLHRAAAHPTGGDAPPEAVAISGTDAPQVPGATRAVPVRHRGEVLGVLALVKAAGDPVTPAEDDLLEGLAAQAGLVLRNVALIEELKASRQRIVAAADAERRRLERDIHDGAQQRLVGLAVRFGLLRRQAAVDGDRDAIELLQTEAQEALGELRDLARGIYPQVLADQGLVAALRSQASRAPIPVQLLANGVGRYGHDIEAAAYFCILEALQNVTKHGEASGVVVRLTDSDGRLTFDVEDDGRGFDPPTITRGTGLQNMADRMAALDGTLEVRSTPGRGTRIEGEIPARILEPVG